MLITDSSNILGGVKLQELGFFDRGKIQRQDSCNTKINLYSRNFFL